MKNMYHLFLRLSLFDKDIEILVSCSASFHKILNALQKMGKCVYEHEEPLIYEESQLVLCDMDVALESLNVQDGMTFIVY